jgi:uncharacterized protein YndB with AHSA1/START domain
MNTLHFTIHITALKETVWHTMLRQDTYRLWTAVFSPGSQYEGGWKTGDIIRFIGPEGGGIHSMIESATLYEKVRIKHLGEIVAGVVQTESPSWNGAHEIYTLTPKDGGTEVVVDIDVDTQFEAMMNEMWPKALAVLKALCEREAPTSITVATVVQAPVAKAWQTWTTPEDIKQWCFASDDWGVGEVTNTLKNGGTFSTEMFANDKSAGFTFAGTYLKVVLEQYLKYILEDGRVVRITFVALGDRTIITETFDIEHENSEDLQRAGWQAILASYTAYTERG